MSIIRRMVFISHHKGDRMEADEFIRDFSDIFIPKVLGANDNDDFINSTDTDYVMRRIREKYLKLDVQVFKLRNTAEKRVS